MFKFTDLLQEIYLSEVSKNDPIPELTRKKSGLAIFLIGPPASGKSTFHRNFIVPRQGNIKRFSTDDISDLRNLKDPEFADYEEGDYIPGSSGFVRAYIEQFVKSNNNDNFVWDATGRDPEKIKPVYDTVRENGYDVMFIHLLISVEKALARVKKRNVGKTQPETDIAYTKGSYTEPEMLRKFGDEDAEKYNVGKDEEDQIDPVFKAGEFASFAKEALSTNKAQSIINKYSEWDHIGYYLVVDLDDKRLWMKYENGKLKVRKNDRYVDV